MNPRKWTAPLSAVFFIVIAALAFTQVRQAGTEYPPPILDPQFELWAWDSEFGGTKPLVWQLEVPQHLKESENQVLLQRTELAGKSALEIRVLQSGEGGWVYVYLRQLIDGTRLTALFSETVTVAIFLKGTCMTCHQAHEGTSTIFGIETNDGRHTLHFLFSEAPAETQQTPSTRTVFLSTAPNQWENHTIDIGEEYENAGWSAPERLEFGVTFQVPSSADGWHVGYLHGFSTSIKMHPNMPPAQEEPRAMTHQTAYIHTLGMRDSESGRRVYMSRTQVPNRNDRPS